MSLRWTLVVCILLLTSVSARDSDWAWFRSVPTGTTWWVTQGQADVTWSGDRFDASLRDGELPAFVRLTLHGSSVNDVVTARVTVENSDSPPFEVSGRLKRTCGRGGGGREILMLTSAVEVIGLQRDLDSQTRCTSSQ